MKEPNRKSRRVYIKDFVKNADGTYDYIGETYSFSGDRKGFLLRIALSAAVCAVCTAAEGFVPAPGMNAGPLVLSAYAVALVAAAVYLWGVVALVDAGDPMRDYKYLKYAVSLPRRALALAICEAPLAVCETVYLAVFGADGKIFGAIVFYALCALCAASALFTQKTARDARWAKNERKSLSRME